MLELAQIQRDEVTTQADLVDAIYRGDALGCIVRGAVAPGPLERVLARLETTSLPQTEVHPGAHIVGCMLGPTSTAPRGPSMDDYLAVADLWWAEPPDAPVREALHGLLSNLAGHAITVVPAVDDRRYAPATLRTFHDGTGAPIHCDTYPPLPCHRHLEVIADGTTQLSWYLVLASPTEGGELTIFDHQHGSELPAAIDDLPRRSYASVPGDLVVFDGGRYYHRIEPTVGSSPRRTLGGFARRAREGPLLYVWG